MTDEEVRAEVSALESRLAQLEPSALPAVEALLRLYGEGLRRIVDAVASAPRVAERLVSDELVAHLLMLHDLHPQPLEERVARALDDVRPALGAHGGNVELVEIVAGVARVRFAGSCSGCSASTATLRATVEGAILRAAPELARVEEIEAAPVMIDLPVVVS